MAERAGFEPAVRGYRTLAFQASALSRSATSPYIDHCLSHSYRTRGWDRRLRKHVDSVHPCTSPCGRFRYAQSSKISLSSASCLAKSPASAVHGSGVRWGNACIAFANSPRRFCKPLGHLSLISCPPIYSSSKLVACRCSQHSGLVAVWGMLPG